MQPNPGSIIQMHPTFCLRAAHPHPETHFRSFPSALQAGMTEWRLSFSAICPRPLDLRKRHGHPPLDMQNKQKRQEARALYLL